MRKRLLAFAIPVIVSSWYGSPLAADVVINEIHAAPVDKTVEEEFVELFNDGLGQVDLSGWSITGGIDFTFAPATVLAPGEFLVVAQDPDTLTGLYGDIPVVGPFFGRLGNEGDDVVLRNAWGERVDEVDYRRGFPWPTLGGDQGYSMELINPRLDNNLGGSWRISDPGSASDSGTLVPAGDRWMYREGTSEASSPVSAWRQPGFNDGAWKTGSLSIGYGEGFIRTQLDMRNNYSSVFLRKVFTVDDPDAIGSLVLDVQFDDGFNAWINGVHVAGANVASEEMPYNGTAQSALEDHSFIEFRLPRPPDYLVAGDNVLAIQLHNASLGGSSDAFLDARLVRSSGAGAGPTPGALNSVNSENAPPLLRHVQHTPEQPVSNAPVFITVKATDEDGVASVALDYQLVDPGSYIRLDDPAYETAWTTVPMHDDGAEGDVMAGDGDYSVVLPAALEVHRRLVRYRITATDGRGLSVTVPYLDDPQPNFAYFVYDGIPGWKGSSHPGTTPVHAFSPEVMGSLPTYHLIAVEDDVIKSQYSSSYEGVHFFGTMVYDGKVYDHVEFENRGEFSTYVSGKNKWRFHFQRGHDFQARDNYGRKYRTRWRTMNFSGVATPWVPTNRGMAGLDEGFAFKLYALAGVPSPNTNFVYFRVIDEALEASASDQYRGDLWGLYMTIEHTDGAFLDERGLPDGNTYKIEGGGGDKRNQGPTQPTNSSDYNALKSGYNSTQPTGWWRANVNLDVYYSFRGTNHAVNNMDLREGWNIAQYHNPETGQWSVIPWDLDMLYMPVTHWSGVMNFQNALSQHPELAIEYKNRVRELVDLLYTPEELGPLIDEFAAFVNPPGEPLTAVDVDEAMWNYHPRTSGSHRGAFYRNPSTHSARGGTITRTLVSADHEGMAQWAKDFMLKDYGHNTLVARSRDAAIPDQPVIAYAGDPSFAVDALAFTTDTFSDPQGTSTFGGMKWRVAEVTQPGAPVLDRERPRLAEINATWESGELKVYDPQVVVPATVLKIGGRYRGRVRMKDTTGRWSHWSLPVEFTAGEPLEPFPATLYLRITELMYHPPGGPDYEFIELQNTGSEVLDLTHVALTDGVEFRFSEGGVRELAPGEYVVVVKNLAAFSSSYDTTDMLIAGEYSGRFDNGGERVMLTYGANAAVLDFAYSDLWQPRADGGGYSLTVVDPLDDASAWGTAGGWRESAAIGGSPGADDGSGPPPGGRQLPGDGNQDGVLDISDAVSLLVHLFVGGGALPCEGGIQEGGNLLLFDIDGASGVNITDVVYLLDYLFRSGPAPALGSRCIRIEGCPTACNGARDG